MIKDFLSPMFLQSAGQSGKREHINTTRFVCGDVDETGIMFGVANASEITVKYIAQDGTESEQAVSAGAENVVAIVPKSNSEIMLIGDVMGLAFGENTIGGQTYNFYDGVKSINTKYNYALVQLAVNGCPITSLDVRFNTALTSLACIGCQLTSLDVSSNTALTGLLCSNNQLTSLDVSSNTALTKLECDNNQLTSLDVSSNTALTKLYCSNNQLTSLDLSANTALTYFNCANCYKLVSISYPATDEDVSTAIAVAITAADSATGTVYTDSAGAYYSTIADAATAKGWTIAQIPA